MCVRVLWKALSGGAIKRIDWGYRSYRYNTHYKFHPEMENEKKKLNENKIWCFFRLLEEALLINKLRLEYVAI